LHLFEGQIKAEVARREGERRVASERRVIDELRRALRGLTARLPEYDLPAARGERGRGGSAAVEDDVEAGDTAEGEVATGPLASVRIVPAELTVAPEGERRARAVAADAEGRPLCAGVELAWSIDGDGLALRD